MKYVNHRHMTCHIAQGLYMVFYFGFSVKSVKVSQWAGRKSVVYGHGIRHGGWGSMRIKKSVNYSLYFNGAEATLGI